MRFAFIAIALMLCAPILPSGRVAAQTSSRTSQIPADAIHAQAPTDPKAVKTYQEGVDLARKHRFDFAVGKFKKADKQDGGHCIPCQKDMRACALETADWKDAQLASEELLAEAQGNTAVAIAHYELGVVLLREALNKNKRDLFSQAHEEFAKAVTTASSFPAALFADGKALAHLQQDAEAKARFEAFVKIARPNDPDRQRAERFVGEPELARARMAPPFKVTTLDGRQVSLDDFQGKVVLLDFWATWCEPCREALPHMKEIAKEFQGQPFVMLSISLDSDEKAWKEFVTKKEMTWLQYRDGGFEGPIARLFNVAAIPHTFTIDSDGILQQENVGDASIDGKLKKLCARAEQEQQALAQTAAQ